MNRTTGRLLTLLAVLTAGAGLFVLLQKWPTLFKKDLSFFPNFRKDALNKLVFISDKGKVEIVKKNDRWLIGEFPADPEKVATALEALGSLKKDNIVSVNPAKYKDFGLEGKTKIQFDKHALYVGAGAGYNQTYVRADRDPLVYAVAADFANLFYSQEFRDLGVYLLEDENKAEAIALSWGDQFLSLVKKNNDWLLNGQKAKTEAVDFLLNEIKTLKGSDIFKKESLALTGYPIELTLAIKEKGQEKKAIIYMKDKETYYLAREGWAFVYQLAPAYVSSLKKEEKDLLE